MVWVAAYVFFVLMSIALAATVLIAMLSSTYARVQENATLECRRAFEGRSSDELSRRGLRHGGARVGQPRGDGAFAALHRYRVQTRRGGGARLIFEDDEDDGEYGVGGFEPAPVEI